MADRVTGRYFVEDLDAVLDTVGADIVVQSTPSPWSLGDGVLRSEVIGFNATLLDSLLGGQDESRGRPAERALFEGVQKLERAGRTVARFPALRVRPTRNAGRHVVSERSRVFATGRGSRARTSDARTPRVTSARSAPE